LVAALDSIGERLCSTKSTALEEDEEVACVTALMHVEKTRRSVKAACFWVIVVHHLFVVSLRISGGGGTKSEGVLWSVMARRLRISRIAAVMKLL
jgi:hypothetical protein